MKTYLVVYCKTDEQREIWGSPFVTHSLKTAIEMKRRMADRLKEKGVTIWKAMILGYETKTQGKNFYNGTYGEEIKEPF